MVPGIGTSQGFRANRHASAICAGVACFRDAICFKASTSARFAARASGAKRGTALRKSLASNVAPRHEADSHALLNQAPHGAGDVLDGDVEVDAVQLQEIDRGDLQSRQHGVDDAANMLGPTIQAIPKPLAFTVRGCGGRFLPIPAGIDSR